MQVGNYPENYHQIEKVNRERGKGEKCNWDSGFHRGIESRSSNSLEQSSGDAVDVTQTGQGSDTHGTLGT